MLIDPFEILRSSIRYLPPRHVRYAESKFGNLLEVLELLMLLALCRLHAPVQHAHVVLRLVAAVEGLVVSGRWVEFYYLRQLLFLLLFHHQRDALDLVHLLLVGLELQLEAEIGADLRPPALEQLERSQEGHVPILDEIGDHQSC